MITKENQSSVTDFLASVSDGQRKDAETLAAMMERISGYKPKMWGGSIIGFGSYHYKYASGHEGDTCITGFSPRKNTLTLYVMGGLDKDNPLFEKLGTHKISPGCLYVKRLSDVDVAVLEELIKQSVAQMKKAHQPSS